jgi:hypothetical protein
MFRLLKQVGISSVDKGLLVSVESFWPMDLVKLNFD